MIQVFMVNSSLGWQTLLATGSVTLSAVELWGYSAVVCIDSIGTLGSVAVGTYCLTVAKDFKYSLFWILMAFLIATNIYSIHLYKTKFTDTNLMKQKLADLNALNYNGEKVQQSDDYEVVENHIIRNNAIQKIIEKNVPNHWIIIISLLASFVQVFVLVLSTVLQDNHLPITCKVDEVYNCYIPQGWTFSVIAAIVLSGLTAISSGLVYLLQSHIESIKTEYTSSIQEDN